MAGPFREPGDPIPPEVVRGVRERAGLSQGEFATAIGLKGRRATVSAWEQGTNPCEGPAAELILRLFPEDSHMAATHDLRAKADKIWSQNGGPVTPYRQLVFTCDGTPEIPATAISGLYDATALSDDAVRHQFPFNVVRDRRYAAATIEGWTAVLPPGGEAAPKYLWLMDRRGRFLHREYCFESQDPARFPWGNLGIGFLIRLAVQATFYISRLYGHLRVPHTAEVTASFQVVGAEGRGFLFEPMAEWFVKVPPSAVAQVDPLIGAAKWTLGAFHADPVRSAVDLTAELVAKLDLEAASTEEILRHLHRLHDFDKARNTGSRELGFLDQWFEKHPASGE